MEDNEFPQAVIDVLQYFDFRHLPERLQAASRPWAEQAFRVAIAAPYAPETVVALRHMVEAKDAAVRAAKGGDATQIVAELRSALGM